MKIKHFEVKNVFGDGVQARIIFENNKGISIVSHYHTSYQTDIMFIKMDKDGFIDNDGWDKFNDITPEKAAEILNDVSREDRLEGE